MRTGSLSEAFLDMLLRELGEGCSLTDDRKSDLTVATVDLSALRLRLSAATPLIQVTTGDIERFGRDKVLEMVRQELIVRQDGPGSAIVLVEREGGFLRALGADPYWAAVLDRDRIQHILQHSNPKRALLETLRS